MGGLWSVGNLVPLSEFEFGGSIKAQKSVKIWSNQRQIRNAKVATLRKEFKHGGISKREEMGMIGKRKGEREKPGRQGRSGMGRRAVGREIITIGKEQKMHQ